VSNEHAVNPIKVGDSFPLDQAHVGDCSGTHTADNGFQAFCVLDEGHGGSHVATNGATVVEVWD
jgi:hypothetical protein